MNTAKLLPPLKLAALAATAALLVTCSAESSRAEDLSGRWSGRWKSCKSGHEGPMKATFCKIDETHYRAKFRGRFWKVVPFRYSVILTVVEDGDVVHLRGSTYLGRIMGTFSYNATATSRSFHATYSAAKDYGTWVLSR